MIRYLHIRSGVPTYFGSGAPMPGWGSVPFSEWKPPHAEEDEGQWQWAGMLPDRPWSCESPPGGYYAQRWPPASRLRYSGALGKKSHGHPDALFTAVRKTPTERQLELIHQIRKREKQKQRLAREKRFREAGGLLHEDGAPEETRSPHEGASSRVVRDVQKKVVGSAATYSMREMRSKRTATGGWDHKRRPGFEDEEVHWSETSLPPSEVSSLTPGEEDDSRTSTVGEVSSVAGGTSSRGRRKRRKRGTSGDQLGDSEGSAGEDLGEDHGSEEEEGLSDRAFLSAGSSYADMQSHLTAGTREHARTNMLLEQLVEAFTQPRGHPAPRGALERVLDDDRPATVHVNFNFPEHFSVDGMEAVGGLGGRSESAPAVRSGLGGHGGKLIGFLDEQYLERDLDLKFERALAGQEPAEVERKKDVTSAEAELWIKVQDQELRKHEEMRYGRGRGSGRRAAGRFAQRSHSPEESEAYERGSSEELSSGSDVDDAHVYALLMADVATVAEARRRKAESQELTARTSHGDGGAGAGFDLPC